METVLIAQHLAPFLPHPLAEEQLAQVATYLDLLVRWNARVNLTSVREPEHIVTRHFGESFFAAAALFPGGPADAPSSSASSSAAGEPVHVLDIGAGAGFPGLPLKLWAPSIRLSLVESNHKKVAFLREAVRALRLTNVDVLAARVQDLPLRAAVVTLRAVERFDTILPAAAGCVAPAGRLALLIGATQVTTATALPGFEWQPPQPLPLSASRVVLIGKRLANQDC